MNAPFHAWQQEEDRPDLYANEELSDDEEWAQYIENEPNEVEMSSTNDTLLHPAHDDEDEPEPVETNENWDCNNL